MVGHTSRLSTCGAIVGVIVEPIVNKCIHSGYAPARSSSMAVVVISEETQRGSCGKNGCRVIVKAIVDKCINSRARERMLC